MIFASILPFALVAISSAGILRRSEQSTNEINGALQVLDRINAGMSKMGQDVKLWDGERPGSEVILEDGRQIISDLGVGAKYMEHATNMGTVDSLQLLGPMETLNALADVFSTELIRKKDMVDRLELAPQALTLLEHARHGALDLSREVTLKLPKTTSWASSPLANNVVQKLDNAIKTFSRGKGQQGPPPQPSDPYQSQPLPWAGQGQSQPQPQPNQGESQPQPNQPWTTTPQAAQPWSSQPQPQQPGYSQQQQGQDQPWSSQPQSQEPEYSQQQQGQDQPISSYGQGQNQGFPTLQLGQNQNSEATSAKPKSASGPGPHWSNAAKHLPHFGATGAALPYRA
ncbi:hypothetical protein EG328_011807 [Venturia inaequalis]|uniref:Uncharacterized protein n=1 Tax=Venturia inaequalis TaxID=5025 RepID=A0A8H3YR50_VENIN|nr:hypothetical protein EG328_011807 [Venturia inaequalis]KAE9968918.1 hypothetical protein EG327_010876 [Venturia inaequalis]RDI80567.1 hypothetical protein Vi05172_g9495 [Venturia inaequalis]